MLLNDAISMKRLTIILSILLLVGCGATEQKAKLNEAKFYEAIDAGNLSEARNMLYDVEGEQITRFAEVLIEEYITIGDVQSAINVYERITHFHCSAYEMQWDNLYGHDGYEKRVCKMLYDALIEADDFETAWKYHPLEYEDPDYAGNGGSYFGYVLDVVIHLVQQGRKLEAQQFLDKHSLWFLKNVDNGEWGEEHPEYQYSKVQSELQSIINRGF